VDNFGVITRLDEMGYTPDTQVQCHLNGEFMLLSISRIAAAVWL
jgi:hypothetical protein